MQQPFSSLSSSSLSDASKSNHGIGKETLKIILKKLNQQLHHEFFDSATEIGSLMISSCFNTIVGDVNSRNELIEGISPYNTSWSINKCEFCVDNLANTVLVSFKEKYKASSALSEEAEWLQIFVDLLVVYSRALIGNSEVMRAKQYLSQAVTISSYLLDYLSSKTPDDKKKHYYICDILADACLKNNLEDEAEIHLKSIPKEFRSVKNFMKLGDIYMKKDKSKEAVACYQEVLKMDKYAISAVEKLIKLGLPEDKKKNLTDYYKKEEWLAKLVDVKYYAHNNQHEKLMPSLKYLEKSFPNNVGLQLSLADCYDQLSKYNEALDLFKQCYKMDGYTDLKTSTYATLLQTTGHPLELQTLSQRLLTTNKGSAESWLVMGIYYTSRSTLLAVAGGDENTERNKLSFQHNMEMAIRSVDKALELNSAFVLAYLWKGHLLLMNQQYAKAIMVYKQAKTISKDIRIFQGLVKAYLALPQHFQDALNAARIAQKHYNSKNDYKPHILLGSVYTMKEELHDNAQKEFDLALKICQETDNEFGMEEALLGKVELDIKRQQFDSAIKTLQSQNLKQNTDSIQTKLGQIYLYQQRFEDAFQCFHKALSLNRFNEIARQELLKLEEAPAEEEAEEEYDM
ncbi:hypothetical protein C9374_000174 [Naegleria lovaniensis]|uniref:Uncharacterized protein n=1 Tax=Naegleria lovaniensis TaxID=51637 RepID=A0AA88KM98_NAELO|nr:uncharacterized protein C9374_000174 [Naegleria lovaniensis]KAG2388735.1 hypothetical protein C9374_000174 [Naegleria lovaniensis]